MPSSWTGKSLHTLGISPLLEEHCSSAVVRTASLQVWYRKYHKYRHDLCIFKTSSGRKLMIAIVSNDSDCQYHIIFYYILSPPPPPRYFLTTVILSSLMFPCFYLQPSDRSHWDYLFFFFFFSFLFLWYCSCSLIFQQFALLKTFLTCRLIYFISPSAKGPGEEFTSSCHPVKALSTLMIFLWNYHLTTFVFPSRLHVCQRRGNRIKYLWRRNRIKYLQFQISYLKAVDWYDGKVKDAKQSVKIETVLLSGKRHNRISVVTLSKMWFHLLLSGNCHSLPQIVVMGVPSCRTVFHREGHSATLVKSLWYLSSKR